MCRTLLKAVALLSLMASAASTQTMRQIPLDDPAYEQLEHFRALGYWSGSLEVRPIRGADLLEALRAIEARARTKPLGAGDVQRLDVLRAAGATLLEAERRVRADSTRSGAPPSWWRFAAALQAFGQATDLDSLPDLDRRPRRDYFFAMTVEAELPRGLYTQWRFFQDYSALTPHPGDAHWVDNLPPNFRDTLTDGSARNDLAVVGWGSSWFNAELGRRERHWGQGRRGTLFLSENPFPLDGLSLQFRTRYVVLSSLFAQSQRGNQDGTRGNAYVAAHRLEIRPPLPFRIALYEAVAYGNRAIDLAYTNPVGFFVAMTQDIFDRTGTDDKKQVGIDASIDLRPVTLYAEFLIDRVLTLDAAEEGEDSPISSFAQLVGLRWASPLGWSGADLDVEYAHLDPQVYFHWDRDVTRAFLSEGELIGHWLGPNADTWAASLRSPPLGRVGSLHLTFEQLRFGVLDGKRGIDQGFFDLQKKDKRWITGDHALERITALTWQRNAWPTRLGALDTVLTAAWVGRSGAMTADDGWLIETRLKWKVDWSTVF